MDAGADKAPISPLMRASWPGARNLVEDGEDGEEVLTRCRLALANWTRRVLPKEGKPAFAGKTAYDRPLYKWGTGELGSACVLMFSCTKMT